MPEITAALVRELRDRTGVAMMDCKHALSESGGDLEKAVDLLRKKGQAKQDKLASREAKEGRVGLAVDAGGKSAAIVEFNCNTDFTANSDPVIALSKLAAETLLKNPAVKLAEDAAVKAQITQVAQQTGENIQLGRTAVLSSVAGKVGTYAHFTGKICVMVAVSGSPSDELLRDLCLQIAATRPLAMTRAELDPVLVAREHEIAVAQAKETGKPHEIAVKIADGKMRTFYEERVLLDQKFVKDATKTITKLLDAAKCQIEKYVRIEVGQ